MPELIAAAEVMAKAWRAELADFHGEIEISFSNRDDSSAGVVTVTTYPEQQYQCDPHQLIDLIRPLRLCREHEAAG